jgi:hypothetical protein
LAPWVDAKGADWIDIKSTLDSYLYRFRFIAAAWHAAQQKGRTISIKQWLSSEKIILLGNDDNARTELDIINRLFFDKLSQLINPNRQVKFREANLAIFGRSSRGGEAQHPSFLAA